METSFSRGQYEGLVKSFDRNGKPLFEGEYIKTHYNKAIFKASKVYNDNGENILDKAGNGYLETIQDYHFKIKGSYKNGYKDGVWELEDKISKNKFRDTYKNEDFVSGTCTDVNGNVRTYKDLQTFPYYDGFTLPKSEGDGVMVSHPLVAKSNDKDGAVAYTFDIDRFGNTNNFKLITSLSDYSDKKTLELIKKKKWHPASVRGITQDTFNYLFIINFHLD